jgi:hypothetical protein
VHDNESLAITVSLAGEVEASADGLIHQRNDRRLASLPLIALHDSPPVAESWLERARHGIWRYIQPTEGLCPNGIGRTVN